MKPLNLFNSNSFPSFESVNNNHHWDLLASSFYHTLYNSLPFRLLVLGNQNLSTNYYVYYFSPIYTNLKQYSITNLLLAYTLPFLYIFSPTLIVPAIFVRSLQFFASKTIAIGSSLTSSKYRTSTTSTTSSLFNLSSSTSSGSSSSSSQRSDGGEGGSDNLTSVQDIEYWLQRCSICFDAQLDFCLDLCRDQFCKDCFQRYVKEVVQNSWGLNITKIKCPVCQDVISQSEWSKYVDQTTIDLYNTYNRPYRSYSRCCNECGEEIFAAKVFQVCAEEKEKYFKEISVLLRKFLETYGVNNNKPLKGKSIANSQFATINNINDVDMFIARFEKDYLTFISNDNPGVGVFEMYQYVAKKIGDCLGLSFGMNNRRSTTKFTRSKLKIHSDMVKSAAEISSKIVALEIRPESWKELQFMHVANFPQSRCTKCYNDICLQCGESTHHPGMTCIQFMRYKVANPHIFIMNNSKTQATYHNNINNNTVDALEIIKWKLENSKSCPNCSILINRDDGCNKVDCLHCGYRFCWVCRDGWSEKCGFYQCRLIKQKKTRIIKPRQQLSINQRAHNNHHQHHHHHHHHHMQQSAPPPPPAPAQVLPAIPLSPPLLTHHHNNNNDNNNQIIELNNIINNVNNANANIINIININVNINNININSNTNNNNNNNMLVSEQIESGMELQELNDEEIEYEDEENYLDEDENDFDDSMIITKNLDDRPEIGVPNVIAIQSKFIANPSI